MIGERLHQKIAELGLTQQRAADQLGISQSRLNQYLKDKREPDGQMLCKICHTFEISPNQLYGFDDVPAAGDAKINKSALETSILFLKKYEENHHKSFSPERFSKIVTVVYDIILSESEENAQKAVEWIIEASA